MKNLITILVLLFTLSAIAQTDSSTSVPNSQLRKALQLIEEGKYTKKRLALADSNAALLTERIAIKDGLIADYQATVEGYVRENANLKQDNERVRAEGVKAVRRERLKRIWAVIKTGIVGVVGIGVAVWLN